MSLKSNLPHRQDPLGWASPGPTSQLPDFLILYIVSMNPHSILSSPFSVFLVEFGQVNYDFPTLLSPLESMFSFSSVCFRIWAVKRSASSCCPHPWQDRDCRNEKNKKVTAHSLKCSGPISWVTTESPGMASVTSPRSHLSFTLQKLFLVHSEGWRK